MNEQLATLPLAPARGQSWKWWVCGLLLLATMINYMDRITLNVLSNRILKELHIDERSYGELESAFAYAFALGAILFGWIADRINVRWLYPAVLLAWSAAGFATGLVEGFLMLWVCRFWLGLCEAGHWPCALKTTQHILPAEQRSLGNGILQSGAALGAVITPLIIFFMVRESPATQSLEVASAVGLGAAQNPLLAATGLLVERNEPGLWRPPFLIIGALGIMWGVIWLLSVRARDLQTPSQRPTASLMPILGLLISLLGFDMLCRLAIQNAAALPDGILRDLVRNQAAPLVVKGIVFVISLLGVLSWLAKATSGETHVPRATFFRRYFVLITVVIAINLTWHFFRAWLPLYLQRVRLYTEPETSGFITLYYLCTDAGSLAVGFVSLFLVRAGLSTHRSRMVTFTVCSVLCLLSIAVAFLETGPLLVAVLLVIGFAALGLFPNYYSFSQELTTQHQGKLSGSLGCINWTAMYFFHDLIGQSIKTTGTYNFGLALAGLAPVVGVAALVFFWGRD